MLSRWIEILCPPAELPSKHYVAEQHLRLVKCAGSVRERLQGEPEWFLTEPAAFKLGVSAEQLRKLSARAYSRMGTITGILAYQALGYRVGSGM
jgi:hypothetical protein